MHENPDKNQPNSSNEFKFDVSKIRPEERFENPLDFYTKEEVDKYAKSKSLMRIQEKISQRVLQLAETRPPGRILDLGIGCGFSTMYFYLHYFETVGIDLNRKFLKYYDDLNINPIEGDMRIDCFRPGSFDLVISISAVQWLFSSNDSHQIKKDLENFVKFVSNALKVGGKVVIQFYPKSDDAMHQLGHEFKKLEKFEGGFIIDNPDAPKKRKIYLVLTKINE